MTQTRHRYTGTVHIIALALGGALSLCGLAWLRSRAAQGQELASLYALSAGGDKTSLKRLSQYPSYQSIPLLQKLARDRNVFAESRAAAIRELGEKPSLDSEVFAQLIQIDQPFVVRHTVAEVLERRGCDQTCIRSTLRSFHTLWEGQPPVEAAASTRELEHEYGVHPDPDLEAKINSDLHAKTEQDYWTLLNSSSCITLNILKIQYPNDMTFANYVQNRLKPCQ